MQIRRAARMASLSASVMLCALAMGIAPAISGDYRYYDDCRAHSCYAPSSSASDYRYDNGRYDDRRYDGRYYRRDADYGRSYDNDDYYRRVVCDSDGDRCYHSRSSYWDFHEYYRRHGYRWED